MAIFKKAEKIPKIEKLKTSPESSEKEISPEKKLEEAREKIIEKKDETPISDVKIDTDQEEKIETEEDERLKKIDDILAFGLNDIFLTLSPDKQQEFKIKGEETRDKINLLLKKTKINVGKIVNLIKKWLSIIPQVNRFFLEQEAKIKADKIIKLKKY